MECSSASRLARSVAFLRIAHRIVDKRRIVERPKRSMARRWNLVRKIMKPPKKSIILLFLVHVPNVTNRSCSLKSRTRRTIWIFAPQMLLILYIFCYYCYYSFVCIVNIPPPKKKKKVSVRQARAIELQQIRNWIAEWKAIYSK